MNATIVVATNRSWYLDPRSGAFTVYLDGKKAGHVFPRGRLVLSCGSGKHLVRIRQGWYFSPPVEVDVAQAASLLLNADVTHRGSVARRVLTLMFAPWRGLSLEVVSEVELPPEPIGHAGRGWPFVGIAGGALLCLFGVGIGSTALAVVGIVAALAFQVIALQRAIALYRSGRRRG
jgi:hypothetical protein